MLRVKKKSKTKISGWNSLNSLSKTETQCPNSRFRISKKVQSKLNFPMPLSLRKGPVPKPTWSAVSKTLEKIRNRILVVSSNSLGVCSHTLLNLMSISREKVQKATTENHSKKSLKNLSTSNLQVSSSSTSEQPQRLLSNQGHRSRLYAYAARKRIRGFKKKTKKSRSQTRKLIQGWNENLAMMNSSNTRTESRKRHYT